MKPSNSLTRYDDMARELKQAKRDADKMCKLRQVVIDKSKLWFHEFEYLAQFQSKSISVNLMKAVLQLEMFEKKYEANLHQTK